MERLHFIIINISIYSRTEIECAIDLNIFVIYLGFRIAIINLCKYASYIAIY